MTITTTTRSIGSARPNHPHPDVSRKDQAVETQEHPVDQFARSDAVVGESVRDQDAEKNRDDQQRAETEKSPEADFPSDAGDLLGMKGNRQAALDDQIRGQYDGQLRISRPVECRDEPAAVGDAQQEHCRKEDAETERKCGARFGSRHGLPGRVKSRVQPRAAKESQRPGPGEPKVADGCKARAWQGLGDVWQIPARKSPSHRRGGDAQRQARGQEFSAAPPVENDPEQEKARGQRGAGVRPRDLANQPRREIGVEHDRDQRKPNDRRVVLADDLFTVPAVAQGPAHRRRADDIRYGESDDAPDAQFPHENHRQVHADAPRPGHGQINRPTKDTAGAECSFA